MAYIAKHYVRFQPSPTPDVIKYRLYVSHPDTPLDYKTTTFVDILATDTLEFTLPDDFEGIFSFEDGIIYNFGLSSVDGAGNISDQVPFSVPFDLTAPQPPSGIVVTSI